MMGGKRRANDGIELEFRGHHLTCLANNVGKNVLMNRMTCINSLIKLEGLNLSYIAFKIKCKNLILA